jgi:hypothetical protein
MNFTQRVAAFWEWYPTVAQRFFGALEAGNFHELTAEIVDFLAATLPGLAWVFGPGEDGGHSFTVTGEGIVPLQILADYWHTQAVEVEGWTFHGSRQASPNLDEYEIELGDLGRTTAADFLVLTELDLETEKVNLIIWHPLFAEIPEEHHGRIVFLFLDETLGEFGVESAMGTLDIEPIVEDPTVSRFSELPETVSEAQQTHGWGVLSPFDNFTAYEAQHKSEDLRGDTLLGITCIPNELFGLFEQGGRLDEDPLAGTGASLNFLKIDSSSFPEGKEVAERERIEMAIAEGLAQNSNGRTLGGGSGEVSCYIDVILFDGEASRATVDAILEKLQFTGDYEWHAFA